MRDGSPVTAAVYLLHGFAGSPASWNAVLESWSAPPAVALALPGHGAPISSDWNGNLDLVAAELPADAIVVGYSLGARVALGLLARDRIRAAVLIGVNTGLADPVAIDARRDVDASWAAMLRHEGIRAFLHAWEAQPLFATQQRVPAGVRQARRAHRAALDPADLALSLETMGLARMPDYRAALIARATRAHLVVGADDGMYLDRARVLLADAPALGFDVIAGSGHDPTLEQPTRLAEVVAAAIERLASDEPRSPDLGGRPASA